MPPEPQHAAREREALGRIRTNIQSRIIGYREQREKYERSLENLKRLEESALEEARAIDAMLALTNPYSKPLL